MWFTIKTKWRLCFQKHSASDFAPMDEQTWTKSTNFQPIEKNLYFWASESFFEVFVSTKTKKTQRHWPRIPPPPPVWLCDWSAWSRSQNYHRSNHTSSLVISYSMMPVWHIYEEISISRLYHPIQSYPIQKIPVEKIRIYDIYYVVYGVQSWCYLY